MSAAETAQLIYFKTVPALKVSFVFTSDTGAF